MSIKDKLIEFLGGIPMSDQSVDVVSDTTSAAAVEPVVADSTPVVADASAVDSSAAVTAEPVAVVSAPTVAATVTDVVATPVATTDAAADTDTLKAAINKTDSATVSDSEWETIVAYAKKADADVFNGIKKALAFLEHEALSVFDEALALAKLKN